MPIASYPPELMEWMLLVGDGQTIECRCPNRAAAVSMRSQVHNLRQAMRKELHSRLPTAERAIFRIQPNCKEKLDGEWVVIGSQKGAEYVQALREAGVNIEAPVVVEDYKTPLDAFRTASEDEDNA